MRIAEAAELIGVAPHRLRHYEATGLLVPERTTAGYRDYDRAGVQRGRQIKALLDSGFTARDVALMLPCIEPDDDPDLRCCAVTRAALTARLEQIRRRRTELERTERALGDWLERPVPAR